VTKKEKEIQKIKKSLGVSKEEAEQIWEDDNSDEMVPEQAELDKKAKQNIKNYTQSEKKFNKGKKKERKVNNEKLQILQAIQEIVGGEIEKEIALHFVQNDQSYTLKLIAHRK
jgi:Asp-tRNA(Asn)/Glu-tRNA(Gln) amidotransferase B subunit